MSTKIKADLLSTFRFTYPKLIIINTYYITVTLLSVCVIVFFNFIYIHLLFITSFSYMIYINYPSFISYSTVNVLATQFT